MTAQDLSGIQYAKLFCAAPKDVEDRSYQLALSHGGATALWWPPLL
jgi:hypothetical protein